MSRIIGLQVPRLLGATPLQLSIGTGTLPLGPVAPSPVSGASGLTPALPPSAADVATDEDKEELELLVEVYGNVMDRKTKKAFAKKGKKTTYEYDRYVAFRNEYFGSAAAYQEYKKTALEELDDNKGAFRKYLDPDMRVRAARPRWHDAQLPFYCWVRKAFEKKNPTEADVFGSLKRGMTSTLRTKLDAVRATVKSKLSAGGYNPRPQKRPGAYVLGTLSDHATGEAIDINDRTNAQINGPDWLALCQLAGNVDVDTPGKRAALWKNNPRGLYDGVAAVNTAFVKKVAEAAAKVTAARQAAAAPTPAPAATPTPAAAAPAPKGAKPAPLPSPALAAHTSDPDLKKLSATFYNAWHKTGFFDHTWELIKACSDEKLVWGATFGDVDLHHFQL